MTPGHPVAVDLFISYAGPDRPWAAWAGHQLEQAGYEIELDVWDWAAGRALLQHTLIQRREVLGADHSVTLTSARYLVRVLRALSDDDRADQIEAEYGLRATEES